MPKNVLMPKVSGDKAMSQSKMGSLYPSANVRQGQVMPAQSIMKKGMAPAKKTK